MGQHAGRRRPRPLGVAGPRVRPGARRPRRAPGVRPPLTPLTRPVTAFTCAAPGAPGRIGA
ncbi:hypothetical protein Ae168Ps1_1202c [Pseudonocardia sp. Ae168_Ps1]|nr:hypothetical protein Ae150APs1_1199c [Pseudonocardia sp. Ae150A_Ps1]OLL78796.1 hypothetical protein Ae168Ps1_1202c [Pseudonocardia sp. Ae168_Ps1]OLL87078.1 hypothetical protein Ae263Ps1_4133 [Pseudonocardia sp. Ae263_Ps1]OLL92891.1 hypothetical protein Ae356Ps1_2788c [Pseudonocardia sp. Ae356_Ps1]